MNISKMHSLNSLEELNQDVEAISQIPIIHNLLEVLCRTTGMGFAAIARVTENRWIACQVRDEIFFGLKAGGELKLETTICNEVRKTQLLVVIDHVEKDEVFKYHPTPLMYGFQSHISVPIMRRDGRFFGTLCAIDPKPASINNPEIIGMFTLFAELISFHLSATDQLAFYEARLLEEKRTAELREQFIAILGHDLRNPVNSVLLASELLIDGDLSEESLRLAKMIKNSSYRMAGLIENILDFARGRLGEGITLVRRLIDPSSLHKLLQQVIAEVQTIFGDSIIETNYSLAESVNCDTNRVEQLFSNLLNNAIIHSRPGTPVIINALSNKDAFRLEIINDAPQIPAEDIPRLFQPFYRGKDKSGNDGLGLGLYISSEITKAHSGRLLVNSNVEKTCFTVIIPTQ